MTEKRYGRHVVKLTREEKVLFPDDGFSKGDLIAYYESVAGYMLPYLKARPLSMKRFPDGIENQSFFQKDAPDYFPGWIETARLKKKDGTVDHVVCNNTATLIYVSNQACIEYHVGLSRTDSIESPQQLAFDLDPVEDAFAEARRAALIIKELFDDLELPLFVKTTGGKGLHLFCPVRKGMSFEDVRRFAERIAGVVAAEQPRHLTTEWRKAKREGRLFLDVARNAYGQTTVAPYSVRARPGAPVSMPLHWEEAGDNRLDPSRFTIKSAPARLDRDGDAWAGMTRKARSLAAAEKRLQSIRT